MAVNLYKLLNVQPTATAAEIRAAIDAAERAGRLDSSMLSAARQALLNPSVRQRYDDRLRQESAPQSVTMQMGLASGGTAAIAYREPQMSTPWITKFGIALALLCLVIGYFVGHTHAMFQSSATIARIKQEAAASASVPAAVAVAPPSPEIATSTNSPPVQPPPVVAPVESLAVEATPVTTELQPITPAAPTRTAGDDTIALAKKLEHERFIREADQKIKNIQNQILSEQTRLENELQALRNKKDRANNNLAGATWEQSISSEMQAAATQSQTRIADLQRRLDMARTDRAALDK